MKPERIKAKLILAGKTQRQIARELNVTESAVSLTISGRSRSARIEQAVAQAIGKPREEVFNHRRAA